MSINRLSRGADGAPRVAERAEGVSPRWSQRDESALVEQARAMAALLPTLMRRLFTFEDDAAEELPLAQLRVCALLYDEPRPMSALSRELGVSVSAMTQIADRLERGRLVQRVAIGTDRRVRCLRLTDRGEKMMRRREEARVRRLLAILGHLPRPARQEILTALRLLESACAVSKNGAEPG